MPSKADHLWHAAHPIHRTKPTTKHSNAVLVQSKSEVIVTVKVKWERKEQWYKDIGPFDQLLTSEEGLGVSIDAAEIERIAQKRMLG